MTTMATGPDTAGWRETVWTIVVAAGSGTRFGGSVPKQFLPLAGRRIVDWSVAAALAVSDGVVVVMPPGSAEPVSDATSTGVIGADGRIVAVSGGATRSASVRAGLDAVPADAEIVLVHDAARPAASPDLFAAVLRAVADGADGVVPAVPVVDTLRHVDGTPIDRSLLEAVQTPQGFRRAALAAAHDGGDDATDDATLVTNQGGRVVTVPGERWNLKVTDPIDELIVTALLETR